MLRSKRMISVFLAAIMIAALITGCGVDRSQDEVDNPAVTNAPTNKQKGNDDKNGSTDTPVETGGMPIVKEPITLKIMARYRQGMADFKDMTTWKEYEKLSNIKIDWIMVEATNIVERRNLALATGDIPDAFLKCDFTPLDLLKYGKEGTFIDLNDLLDANAPNYKGIIDDEENYPGVKKSIAMADGNIYSFIYILHKDFESLKYNKFFMNRKWLDAVGKDMPVTTDEFYDVLKAFKEEDPNQNGQEDELPWYPDSIGSAVATLKGAWGLQNKGFKSGLIDFNETEEKLRFIPTDPNYKELLEYVNKLYTEKLIDQEVFTATLSDLLAKGNRDMIGSFSAAGNTFVGDEHKEDFEGLEHALKGPHGDQLWSQTNHQAFSTGSFVITSANKYPEETMRWIDYFYTEDGMKLYFLGKEGVTYTESEDGELEFMDNITNNPDGLQFNDALFQHVPYAVGDNPALLAPKYFQGVETQPIPTEAALRMKPYGLTEIWSGFNYLPEENDVMIALNNDIGQYVTEKAADFITGKMSFSDWDVYVKNLEKMGLDEYMEIQETAYKRYSEK